MWISGFCIKFMGRFDELLHLLPFLERANVYGLAVSLVYRSLRQTVLPGLLCF